MNFTERIIGMIVKPDATTKDIAQDPRIEEGLMIVGVYMILGIIAAYLTATHMQYVGSSVALDASTMNMILLISEVVGIVAMIIIGWPILTAIVHVLSMFMGSNGKYYPNMLTLIGYTAIPLIFVMAIQILLVFMTPVTTIDLSAGAQNVASGMLSSPIAILSVVVELIGSILTAYMMLYAVKNGEKVGMNSAYVVVGLLFVLNLLLKFSSIILAFIKL